ncbi:ABC transporter ATP-binding protein [Propionivibrio sp.]|uniref:ABC transporter ATP-binding protein n=1 Tax=Propionivibrio sp. TaxID=2212460 RepID=UPI00260A7D38|nr:ABC transporter ATP-binding protein [Propionivibrio sp.]
MSSKTPLLEARKLTVSIGGKTFCRDLDLTLHAGERLAILGRNGAGKSTLLSVLAGLRAEQSGEVLIDGLSYASLGARKSALVRGWLPQVRGDAFASTVLETALVGRHPHLDRWGWESDKDAKIVRQALAAVDLTSYEQRDIQTLSGGERQRLAIATLLAQAPQLFLLDEPIAHLDLKHQIAMLELFSGTARDCGAAVAMVLHEPALAWRFCDRALLMHGDGRTESGPTREILTVDRLSALYQYPLQMLECDGRVSFIPN